MSNTQYCVFPETPDYRTVVVSEDEKASLTTPSLGLFGKLGMSAWVFVLLFVIVAIISFVVAFALFGEGIIQSFGAFMAVFCLPSIIIPLLISSFLYLILEKITSSEKEKGKAALILRETTINKEAREKELARVNNEATSLTISLTKTYNTYLDASSVLSDCLEDIVYHLDEAEKEYYANAFAPYWDEVEAAAKYLGIFNDIVVEIAEAATDYYQKLNGRNHSFPIFSVHLQDIPDVSPLINRLHQVVRLGQTNYHFANIWEQRKTREVMIAGFRTLNEAVYNLGDTIKDSVSDLRNSISSDIAVLVHEQIRTRESIDKSGASVDKRLLEQNRMLDNIQHDRAPKLKDTPSKS